MRAQTTPRAQIDLLDEIIVDNFAGGGGASTRKFSEQFVPSAVAEDIVETLMRENDELLEQNKQLQAEVDRLRRELIRNANGRDG